MCREREGICDIQDECSGISDECVDNVQNNGTVCREKCCLYDIADECNGESKECPDRKSTIPLEFRFLQSNFTQAPFARLTMDFVLDRPAVFDYFHFTLTPLYRNCFYFDELKMFIGKKEDVPSGGGLPDPWVFPIKIFFTISSQVTDTHWEVPINDAFGSYGVTTFCSNPWYREYAMYVELRTFFIPNSFCPLSAFAPEGAIVNSYAYDSPRDWTGDPISLVGGPNIQYQKLDLCCPETQQDPNYADVCPVLS